jgi:predicted pyridoxine 5'-phosphate oxidase superfamily flavin-nucleotide-binding protein
MNTLPYLALAPLSREILGNADRLPDAELMRIAGSLRVLADEVMSVIDQRLGARPAPRLVVDNTGRR